MKEGYLEKSAGQDVSPEQMEKINRYSRRELQPGEVYTFSVVLCDNEVDRDYERFTVQALHDLARLFLGKTGIFDHDPKGENQTARIFDTQVITDPSRKTQTGETYTALKAAAYMVRSAKTQELILEIDAGIKKEVSVGCSVEQAVCSICGADQRNGSCKHRAGKTYNGKICHIVLEAPTDAYEWSFVAVPAQVGAGVVKRHGSRPQRSAEELVEVIKSASGELRLSAAEAAALSGRITLLEKAGALAKHCQEELRKEVVRLNHEAGGVLPSELAEEVAGEMDWEQLNVWKKSCREKIDSGEGIYVQLAPKKGKKREDHSGFLI